MAKRRVCRRTARDPAAEAAMRVQTGMISPEAMREIVREARTSADPDAIYDSEDPIGEYPLSYGRMVRGFVKQLSAGELRGGLAPGYAHDLVRRIDRLEAALSFYSDPRNWKVPPHKVPFDGRLPVSAVGRDRGKRASAAFEAKERE